MAVPTEAELLKLLRRRYPKDAYAFFTHVANGTGSRITRTADAVAMGLWPSRGLDLYGFEVKRTRRDWIREYEDPAKAEPIARYCSEWWIVTGEDKVVAAEELPRPWGLMTLKGQNLVIIKRPEVRHDADPVDKVFLASLLRSAQSNAPAMFEVEAARKEGYEHGFSQGQQARERAEKRARDLESLIQDFQQASGLRLSPYHRDSIPAVGAAVRAVLNGDNTVRSHRESLLKLRERARSIASVLDEAVMDLDPPQEIDTDQEAANVRG